MLSTPTVPAVVTIGQIAGGTARNVIADRVTIKGTARTRDPEAEKRVEEALRRVVAGVAASLRLEYDIDWVRQTPVMKNDPQIVAHMVEAAREVVGADKVVNLSEPVMGSEDFSYVLQRVPGAMANLGTRPDTGPVFPNHSNRMLINESALANGIAMHVAVALRFFERAPRPS